MVEAWEDLVMRTRVPQYVTVAAIFLPLAACGGGLTPIFERSVQDEHPGRDHHLITMTGERRVALIVPVNGANFSHPAGGSGYRICAESLPDAARAAGARTSLEAQM